MNTLLRHFYAVLLVSALLAPCSLRAQTQEIQNEVEARLLLARALDQGDENLGATLQPVSEALRAQLDVPAGQGLLVASLRADGPGALAGLKQNDILLSLADKPLAAAADLTKHLKAAGDAAVQLKMLRAGKPVSLPVRPIYHVTLGPVAEKKTEYFIGVSMDPVDEALRNQLGLAANQGVVITDVVASSPAEKAGVKKHDIVLEMGDKAIEGTEALAQQVQASKEKPTTLKLLRGGKTLTIPIAAAVRQVEPSATQEALRLWMIDRRDLAGTTLYHNEVAAAQRNQARAAYVTELGTRLIPANAANNDDLRQRLDLLDKELKALRETLDKVNDTLKAGKPKRD